VRGISSLFSTSGKRTFSAPSFVRGVAAAVVIGGLAAGCQTSGLSPYSISLSSHGDMYASVEDGDYKLPPINLKRVNKRFLRQMVDYKTEEKPGTLVVDTKQRYVYLVLRNGKALRYGVAIGKAGFAWSGRAYIGWKQEWPKWFPPKEMIARRPDLKPYKDGMDPGLKNPLGARALYIYQDGRDTLYRLHGTNQPSSIGRAASSGCVRFFNQDIIDLYSRVPEKTPIVVL